MYILLEAMFITWRTATASYVDKTLTEDFIGDGSNIVYMNCFTSKQLTNLKYL